MFPQDEQTFPKEEHDADLTWYARAYDVIRMPVQAIQQARGPADRQDAIRRILLEQA